MRQRQEQFIGGLGAELLIDNMDLYERAELCILFCKINHVDSWSQAIGVWKFNSLI